MTEEERQEVQKEITKIKALVAQYSAECKEREFQLVSALGRIKRHTRHAAHYSSEYLAFKEAHETLDRLYPSIETEVGGDV